MIVRGEGVYIYDAEGNRLLDGPAGMWCMQTGYGRREIADAVAEQIMNLSYATTFTVINNREVELAERIAAKTPGRSQPHLFHHRRLHSSRLGAAAVPISQQHNRSASP